MFSGVSWSYALGTQTIPSVRADSLRDLRLLPSPSLVQHTHPQASLRGRARAGASQLRAVRLRICGHARTRSPAAQRTAAAYSGRRDQVVEAGSLAAADWRGRAFLAKALL